MIKARVVSEDEREAGLRKILNYGHTLGHALETITDYKKFKHGEAISIGMNFAAHLSFFLGLCPEELIQRQVHLFRKFKLPVSLPSILPEKLIEVMSLDKKVLQGNIHFVLPVRVGKVVVQAVERRDILCVLQQLAKKKRS